MAEYIEREAAIEMLCAPITMSMCLSVSECQNKEDQRKIDAALIKSIPAADVAPVVRCKDCKHSYEDLWGRVCSYGVSVDCVVPDDFFCADGAKMDKEETE